MKPDEFEKALKIIHPNLKLINPYIKMKNSVDVEDELGIVYRLRPQDLLKGKTPTLQGAVDRNKAFEIKGRTSFGDKYDYSKVEYTNARNYVTIICPIHGEFQIVPDCHVNRGTGCGLCGRLKGDLTKKSLPSNLWKMEDWKKAALKSPRFTEFKFYIIRCWFRDEEFYKIGRTYRSMRQRFGPVAFPYNYEQTLIVKDTCENVCDLEDKFKAEMKDYIYAPTMFFYGSGECFYDNQKLQTMIQELKLQINE